MITLLAIFAQTAPSGSPDWFSWGDFVAGWACAFATVGPMWIYRLAKKSADDALD